MNPGNTHKRGRLIALTVSIFLLPSRQTVALG